jgi:hypothetical protein
MNARKIAIVVGVLAAMTGTGVVACDDSSNAVKEPVKPTSEGGGPSTPGVDGGGGPQPGTDGGGPTLPDGAPSDCFMNPKTHLEIINACTNAVKITKNPTLPLLLPDGGLPPTP